MWKNREEISSREMAHVSSLRGKSFLLSRTKPEIEAERVLFFYSTGEFILWETDSVESFIFLVQCPRLRQTILGILLGSVPEEGINFSVLC